MFAPPRTGEEKERNKQAVETRRALGEVRRTKPCFHSASGKCIQGRCEETLVKYSDVLRFVDFAALVSAAHTAQHIGNAVTSLLH